MNSDLDSLLRKRLNERESKGLLRSSPSGPVGIDFVSNDYLGIDRDYWPSSTNIEQQVRGSRNLIPTTETLKSLEHDFAEFFGYEQCMVLPSGYQANLALIQAITTRDQVIIFDEESHNSIRTAIRLTGATARKFKHNDLDSLESRLKQSGPASLVIIESLYSMSGDIAPFEAVHALCEKFNAFLLVDESHTAGWFSEQGRFSGRFSNLDNVVCTVGLGKGMGTQGGLILGSGTVMQSIINFGDSAIYTTAVSGMHIQELSEKLNLVKAADEPRSKLAKIIAYFNATFGNYPGFQPKKGPIQAIKVSSPEEAVQLKEFLAENKLSVSAVRYPTVAKGDDRLRISLHSYNTKEEVLELRHVIERFK